MPTYCAISDKQEIGAFYRTHHIDDGDGATTVTAEDIREKFSSHVSRNSVPQRGRLRR